jgi:hypothetical protein
MSALTPPPVVCRSCGQVVESVNRYDWCDACDDMIDRFTDSKY